MHPVSVHSLNALFLSATRMRRLFSVDSMLVPSADARGFYFWSVFVAAAAVCLFWSHLVDPFWKTIFLISRYSLNLKCLPQTHVLNSVPQ